MRSERIPSTHFGLSNCKQDVNMVIEFQAQGQGQTLHVSLKIPKGDVKKHS